ncbi:hypothetical protein LCGC14_1768620 [marine sediment metagenome]|uniref:Uncharacterized protein n=1 Tax=marine sediment metagenome TaxID=412755 RepID=A0A0F9GYV9_9ZZZZ
MAHTYDVTTDIGKVRLLIGDTDITPTTDAQFSDEEIQAFLTMASSSLLLAASYALEAWASAVSGNMKTERIGDYSYGKDEAKTKSDLAKKYREENDATPYLTWAEMNLTRGSAITAEED